MARKSGQSTRKPRSVARNNSRRNRARRSRRRDPPASGKTTTAVHRRLVLFPTTTASKWLTGLSWFASVAMTLIKAIVGVEHTPQGIRATSLPVSSGVVILLGPGDFASHSSFASFYSYDVNAKDVDTFSLRALPFEKMALPHVSIRIAPTVDLGKRGGLYAAILERLDTQDSRNSVESNNIMAFLKRYPTDYQDIIKHPRAKLSPVTKPLQLAAPGDSTLFDIKARNDTNRGWVNDVYTHVLCIAFSDMASIEQSIDDNYSPNHGLFELHMTGRLVLSDPAELTLSHALDKPTDSASVVTSKLTTSSVKRLTKFFHHVVEEHEEHEGMLYSYPKAMREAIATHYGVESPMGFEMQ